MKTRSSHLHILAAACLLCVLPGLARAETVPLILPPEGESREETETPSELLLPVNAVTPAPTETPVPAPTPEPLTPKVPPELMRVLYTASPEPVVTPSPTPSPTPEPSPTPVPTPFNPRCDIGLVECWCGRPVDMTYYLERITAGESCTVSYAAEPDWNRPGRQGAALLIENERGEKYVHPFTVRVLEDTEPPVLKGVKKLYVYLDEAVVYKDGVTVTDNADPAPAITVDTSKVNLHEKGTYPVTYTATDFSGNTTVKETKITLMEPKYTEEYVYELADAVLEKVTKPGMTTTEKLKAIFDWGRKNVKYGYGVGHTDWRRAAVMGFTKGRGDCYGFYSTTRALLDRLGIPYVSMERLGGKTRHYWVLVNVGTGWYHFDTTVANSHKHKCFMWTDKQCHVKSYFWRYDHDLCPVEVATEPFDYEAQVAYEMARMTAEENA